LEYRQGTFAFSVSDSRIYGELSARPQPAGQPIKTQDALIAAIRIANNATLAMRNSREFEGLDLKLINPFES
jgi:toxin FitB